MRFVIITPPPWSFGRTNLETKVLKIGGRNKTSGARALSELSGSKSGSRSTSNGSKSRIITV